MNFFFSGNSIHSRFPKASSGLFSPIAWPNCTPEACKKALRTWNLILTRIRTSSLYGSSLKHHVPWVSRALAKSSHADISSHTSGPHLGGNHDVLLGSHHALHGHHHARRAHGARVAVEASGGAVLARDHAHGGHGVAHEGGLPGHGGLCWWHHAVVRPHHALLQEGRRPHRVVAGHGRGRAQRDIRSPHRPGAPHAGQR